MDLYATLRENNEKMERNNDRLRDFLSGADLKRRRYEKKMEKKSLQLFKIYFKNKKIKNLRVTLKVINQACATRRGI